MVSGVSPKAKPVKILLRINVSLTSCSYSFMKLQYIIMFQFILALFGCNKEPSSSTASSMLGPFTIETITKTGKSWNINYGRVPYTNISYDVKYKGQPLKFKGGLVNKLLIQQIGKGFNALLDQGKYKDEFTEDPQANQ